MIVVGAVLIAVLSFGIGFIAGNAASLFDGLFGGPGRGANEEVRGSPTAAPRGDGRLPGPARRLHPGGLTPSAQRGA